MIRQISVMELKERLDNDNDAPVILDVREPWEVQICALPNAIHIPMGQIPARIHELGTEREIVVVCHHGVRSYQVAYFLQHQGFGNLVNLRGGIDAWAKHVDPAMATY